MLLAEIREDAAKFSKVISQTLDVDVLIVDHLLKTISNTFRYFDRFSYVHRDSVIGSVIENRKVVAVDDIANFPSCRICSNLESCEMAGMLGVPIFYDDAVVGAIALVLPKQRISAIFQDIRGSIAFVESMADLLSNKLRTHENYKTLNAMKREREILMDSMTDAVVSTDSLGYITYCNRQFEDLFSPEKSCVGEMLTELIPHGKIRAMVDSPSEEAELLAYHDGKCSFCGFASCSRISDSGFGGIIFKFRCISRLRPTLPHELVERRGPTFAQLDEAFFGEETIREAKRAATTAETVLIRGEKGTGKTFLAQCIHNFSDRAENVMSIVDCDRISRENINDKIFGILGQLQMAHGSTLLFQNIECLPWKLQKRLVSFLQKPMLKFRDVPEMEVDVSLIFSTSADLERLTDTGVFCDELYYRICANCVTLPPLRESPELLKAHAYHCISYYKDLHKKPNVSFDRKVLDAFWKHDWRGNIQELETVIDTLVSHENGAVTLQSLHKLFPAFQSSGEQIQTLESIERELIERLLDAGNTKEQIARELGLSRATVYRKIKEYSSYSI